MQNLLKKAGFLYLLISLSYPSLSQNRYAKTDSVAASVNGASIAIVHNILTKKLSTDEEKSRAFYIWMTHHINYDVQEWLRPDKFPAKQEPEQVFKNKKAVCSGYSELFLEFCNLSGIPCYVASGYTRVNNNFEPSGHAWNIVFVNGKWQQVDVTWGSGGIDQENIYVKDFQEKYFLPGPDDFLNTHYPLDPMWQLVLYPVKLTDYKKRDWEYSEKSASYFSFNDTIAKWEKLDSLEKEYTSAIRMLRFSPGDQSATEHYSYALFSKGDAEFDKANKLLNVVFKPNRSGASQPTGNNYRTAQLDSIDNYYSMAESYYLQVKSNDRNVKDVLKHNLDALNFNRDVVKKELANISRQ